MLSDHNLQSISRDALKANTEDSFAKELEMMLHEQCSKEIIDMDRDIMNIYRSGSAPPTVDGSLTAMRSLFGNSSYVDYPAWMNRSGINGSISEEDVRFLHENLNPKVAQPLSPEEDWHQKFQVGNSDSSKSLFSSQPGQFPQTREANLMDPRMITPRNLARQPSAEWLEKDADSSNGLDVAGLPTRARSLVDIRQDDPGLLPRPMSCNAVENVLDTLGSRHSQPTQLPNRMKSLDDMYSLATAPDLVRDQYPHSSGSSTGACLSQNTVSEATRIGRTPAHYLHEEGIVGTTEKKNISISKTLNSFPSRMTNCDLAASLSGLSLSENRLAEEESQIPHQFQELDSQPTFLHGMLNGHGKTPKQHFVDQSIDAMGNATADNDMAKNNGSMGDLGVSPDFLGFPGRTDHLYSGVHAASLQRSSGHYQDVGGPKFGTFIDIHSLSQRPNGVMDNSPNTGTVLRHSLEESNMGRLENQVDYGLRLRGDPLFVQNLQKTCGHDARSMQGLNGPDLGINYLGTSDADFLGFQKAYLGALLAQQKQLYEMSALGNSGSYGNGYYGNHAYCLSTTLPGARIASPRRPIWQNEQIPCYPSRIRSSMSGSPGSWHLNNGGLTGESSPPSLLEELKNNKGRSLELSEIVDHVVKFSADQYGSRFIQQKLETATAEEKNKLFQEIMPHALTLMTDVFGNYVIQKFFEHGTEAHRKELASQISGHVLPLSLQMYGCRVIQKALEMVDVDRQAQLVAELDGSVMKCIRDQNGNHVIQKCIECVPQDRIQFIISSFYGQVVALSTHPYGCRVIQRVLEHCDDANTQKIVMEEILQSACNLAQDQYGNYVVQHVLQHGKPQERSAIISELAGQIVKMSQQKFASNVVEKCLTFGGPEERQLLVNEMLGSTDENEPLQAMMKDPFANYVVQKLLETCDSRSRDLILSRIKVHLNALKRYTYGKHIVARVEKLINTEERRIGISSSSYSF